MVLYQFIRSITPYRGPVFPLRRLTDRVDVSRQLMRLRRGRDSATIAMIRACPRRLTTASVGQEFPAP
jgi:hypothetical protein